MQKKPHRESYYGFRRILSHRLHRNAKGWVDISAPNPILMLPVGFDPGTNNYKYLTNGTFGRSVSFGAATSARISLGISFSGPPQEEEMMRLAMTRLNEDGKRLRRDSSEIKRIYTGRTQNLYTLIYQYRDSIGLNESEKLALVNGSKIFAASLDSIWSAPSALLATMQPFKSRKAFDEVELANQRTAALTLTAKRHLSNLLNSRVDLLPRRIVILIALPKEIPQHEEEMYDEFEED